ncbi:hypothetical protein MSAN_02361000 [Mycena sanguinolenta]|uniref:Protein kinase domain-containing protein n=1 Tax=Mycena sanguinolenta TaxID=230812 RepID=A0A8H6X5H3_9AGAR|nr:hypothetical protein MSAN_02361000 [Mycena sanguinolenta]
MAADVPRLSNLTNDQKVVRWDEIYSKDGSALERHLLATDIASAWLRNPNATYSEALTILDQIPPMRPGNGGEETKCVSMKERTLTPLAKVTLEPAWIDTVVQQRKQSFDAVVPDDARINIHPHLNTDRRKPASAELTEGATDEFHLTQILRPAVAVAAMTVQDEQRLELVSIEDKRLEVFSAHCAEFCGYGAEDKFPWPEDAEFETAKAGMRMWIQVWGQMEAYHVNYAKVFSVHGVIHIRRSETRRDELIFSRTYTCLDGEVTRSVCLILEARERNIAEAQRLQTLGGRLDLSSQLVRAFVLGCITKWKLLAALFWGYWTGSCAIYILFNNRALFFRDVSRQVGITRRFLPTLFTQFVGEGASGVVWRSLSGSQVVKMFHDRDRALHEVKVLEHARDLRVPTLQGVVEDGVEIGVIMSYEGIPLGGLNRATFEQRRQLLDILKSLHARGIHHHDIRGSNILVGPQGAITLIDFDRAELDAKCVRCSDIALKRKLEAGSVSGYL